MKQLILVILICLSIFAASCSMENQSTKPQSHTFLTADYGGAKVAMVSAEGKITWQYPAPGAQDVWLLKNGNIFFSHGRGAKVVTMDKKVVWEYSIKAPNEVHACQPLKNGNYMVAVSGVCEIREIDQDGNVVKTVKLKTEQNNPHGQMRGARQIPNGNYLVGHCGEAVREYSPDGKVIRKIKASNYAHAAYRLPNGNTLISTGDNHKIIKVDKDDNIVWQVNENDLEGNPLRYVAGMQRLKNGNTVVANWGGHGHVGEQPQIFEVTPDKKVVWQIFDFETFNTISNMKVLDRKAVAE